MEEVLVYLSIIHKGNWNKIYKDILEKRAVNKEDIANHMQQLSTSYITLLSKNYPQCLKSIYKPPFVLFYKGNINLLSDNKTRIAVIGSRINSEYGRIAAEDICKDLVDNKIIIVSGLAKGIDAIAHSATIKNNGYTIAVLGNGLNITYPKENENLYRQIEKTGLIISEYPFDVCPDSSNFPNRNRIIAAISNGVVVIEAKEKSGTMNTVSHALEDGKSIFCIPERRNLGSGCNKLIKEGAKLIETAKDIIDEL